MTPYQIYCLVKATLSRVAAICSDGRNMTDLLDLVFEDVLLDARAPFAKHEQYDLCWYDVADDFADIADAIERSTEQTS